MSGGGGACTAAQWQSCKLLSPRDAPVDVVAGCGRLLQHIHKCLLHIHRQRQHRHRWCGRRWLQAQRRWRLHGHRCLQPNCRWQGQCLCWQRCRISQQSQTSPSQTTAHTFCIRAVACKRASRRYYKRKQLTSLVVCVLHCTGCVVWCLHVHMWDVLSDVATMAPASRAHTLCKVGASGDDWQWHCVSVRPLGRDA